MTHLIAAVVGSFLLTCFGTVVITSVVTVFVTKRHQSKQSRPPTSNWCELQQHNYEANSERIYEMVDPVKVTEEPDYDFVGHQVQNNAYAPHTHTQSQ